MYVHLIPVRRFQKDFVGEAHITHEPNLLRLRHDAANPLPPEAVVQTLIMPDKVEVLNNLALYFMDRNFWVCWCDDPHSYPEG